MPLSLSWFCPSVPCCPQLVLSLCPSAGCVPLSLLALSWICTSVPQLVFCLCSPVSLSCFCPPCPSAVFVPLSLASFVLLSPAVPQLVLSPCPSPPCPSFWGWLQFPVPVGSLSTHGGPSVPVGSLRVAVPGQHCLRDSFPPVLQQQQLLMSQSQLIFKWLLHSSLGTEGAETCLV